MEREVVVTTSTPAMSMYASSHMPTLLVVISSLSGLQASWGILGYADTIERHDRRLLAHAVGRPRE